MRYGTSTAFCHAKKHLGFSAQLWMVAWKPLEEFENFHFTVKFVKIQGWSIRSKVWAHGKKSSMNVMMVPHVSNSSPTLLLNLVFEESDHLLKSFWKKLFSLWGKLGGKTFAWEKLLSCKLFAMPRCDTKNFRINITGNWNIICWVNQEERAGTPLCK